MVKSTGAGPLRRVTENSPKPPPRSRTPKEEDTDASPSTPKKNQRTRKHKKRTTSLIASPSDKVTARPSKRKKIPELRRQPGRHRDTPNCRADSQSDDDASNDESNTRTAPRVVCKNTDDPDAASAEPSETIREHPTPPVTPRKAIRTYPPPTPSTPRKGKQGRAVGSRGRFSEYERELLEDFKIDFCNTHGINGFDFNLMVQHSDRDPGDGVFPKHLIRKHDFWDRIYEVLPTRNAESVCRFMRRHFLPYKQVSHTWTAAQDEELISHHLVYGAQWAFIAKQLDRSSDDVAQRWRNQLQHRTTMNQGVWSQAEIQGLLDTLQAMWDRMKQVGEDALLGRDIYEMDPSIDISWYQVSHGLSHSRSEQQCGDKWRKIRRKVLLRRVNGEPDAVFDAWKEAWYPTPVKRKDSSPGDTSKQYERWAFVPSDDELEGKTPSSTRKSMSRSLTPKHWMVANPGRLSPWETPSRKPSARRAGSKREPIQESEFSPSSRSSSISSSSGSESSAESEKMKQPTKQRPPKAFVKGDQPLRKERTLRKERYIDGPSKALNENTFKNTKPRLKDPFKPRSMTKAMNTSRCESAQDFKAIAAEPQRKQSGPSVVCLDSELESQSSDEGDCDSDGSEVAEEVISRRVKTDTPFRTSRSRARPSFFKSLGFSGGQELSSSEDETDGSSSSADSLYDESEPKEKPRYRKIRQSTQNAPTNETSSRKLFSSSDTEPTTDSESESEPEIQVSINNGPSRHRSASYQPTTRDARRRMRAKQRLVTPTPIRHETDDTDTEERDDSDEDEAVD
ncbi:hypothetical protein P168DRAFT_317433 [Aspergillus campestris IBT 28561]|uniref:Myb-like domain-containing protein n=1 Tax=Aspergillus campestris (strain IBT 28561) TaxID=1392248 RepID=A0A2I1D7S1_ASPC2|nr:uncharacterized protein P168DRAFT_317433 [Aspergillus campestris IBT 28561]PKY05929.1 hypothetical protein P168DRAFT_317433 [Aspergillus campestris IBT 28561]